MALKKKIEANCGVIIPVKWANSLRKWGLQNCMRKHKIHIYCCVCSWLKNWNGNTSYCSTSLSMVGVILGKKEDFFKREISINPEPRCVWPLHRMPLSWPRTSHMWWTGQSCCLSTFLLFLRWLNPTGWTEVWSWPQLISSSRWKKGEGCYSLQIKGLVGSGKTFDSCFYHSMAEYKTSHNMKPHSLSAVCKDNFYLQEINPSSWQQQSFCCTDNLESPTNPTLLETELVSPNSYLWSYLNLLLTYKFFKIHNLFHLITQFGEENLGRLCIILGHRNSVVWRRAW